MLLPIAKLAAGSRVLLSAASPLLRDALFYTLERCIHQARDTWSSPPITPMAWSPDENADVFASPGLIPRQESTSPFSADMHHPAQPAVHLHDASQTGPHTLLGRITHRDNLMRAWRRLAVKRNTASGSDRQSLASFAARLEAELHRLAGEMQTGTYRPHPLQCWHKTKEDGRKRLIAIPTIRDRVAQAAICQILEFSVAPTDNRWSFAYQNGRGCREALAEVDQLLVNGGRWVVRADVQDCFDSIPHASLLAHLAAVTGDDPSVRGLLLPILQGPRLLGRRLMFPRLGVPQGSPLSPFLANIYLNGMDHTMGAAGFKYLRYADDLIIVCREKTSAHTALEMLREECRKLELQLNPAKSKVLDVQEQGFDFLGHRYTGGTWQAIPERIERVKRKIQHTLKSAGRSGAEGVTQAKVVLAGWKEFYRYRKAIPNSLIRWFDSQIRRKTTPVDKHHSTGD